MDLDIDKYIFVISSKQRREIIVAINIPLTPTQIHRKVKERNKNISLNNVCTLLSLLKKKDIVICINEEQKKGRLYKLTMQGEKIKEHMLGIGIQ